MEPMDVPEQGHMAIFGDASGAAIGVWQPREMSGYELVAEPGAAAWHELHTKDYDAAVKFYQNVFGWDTDVMSDSPEFRYTTLGAGDVGQGRASWTRPGYLPAEVPSNWQVYFAVEDTDASIEKAVALGATVLDGPRGLAVRPPGHAGRPHRRDFQDHRLRLRFPRQQYRPAASLGATGRYSFVMTDTWGWPVNHCSCNLAPHDSATRGINPAFIQCCLCCAGHHLTGAESGLCPRVQPGHHSIGSPTRDTPMKVRADANQHLGN